MIGGAHEVSARFRFEGRLQPDAFCAFVRHRAARLSLALEGLAGDARAVTCNVRGPLALVDMFEMACSLGPLECLVMEVAREDDRQERV